VAEDWRRLRDEELHNLHASPNIIGMIESRKTTWKGHVTHIGGIQNSFNILIGKHEGKKPFGRPRRRRKNNIRIDLREILWDICGSVQRPALRPCKYVNYIGFHKARGIY
jgi:hypothetical protein